MSRSSISGISVAWLGRHRPRCQSPPPLKNGVPWSAGRWASIAGLNLSRNACPPDPRLVEHLPRRRQRLVQNSSSRSRSSGVNSIRARLSGADHAPRALRAMGWVGAYGRVPLVATLSGRDDDLMPTTGRTSRWSGLDRGLSRHGSEPGRSRRLRFHRTLSVRSWSGSGNAPSPKGDDFAATASGRISAPKAVVSLTQGDRR